MGSGVGFLGERPTNVTEKPSMNAQRMWPKYATGSDGAENDRPVAVLQRDVYRLPWITQRHGFFGRKRKGNDGQAAVLWTHGRSRGRAHIVVRHLMSSNILGSDTSSTGFDRVCGRSTVRRTFGEVDEANFRGMEKDRLADSIATIASSMT
jgi:hypothetical protein